MSGYGEETFKQHDVTVTVL